MLKPLSYKRGKSGVLSVYDMIAASWSKYATS